ncbi:glycerate kinase [Chamaesiphon sp.]|uniref:glycerate kinase type-2 family protein n=1 Tax=Chamaesiphon sp. TaxID=2814140 RepID=UPI003593C437
MQAKIQLLIDRALAAVDPFNAIQNHLVVDGEQLIIREHEYDLKDKDIRCICIGKAAVPMSRAINALFGDRISQGLVVTKYHHLGDLQLPGNWESIESAHPVPDRFSLAAGERMWDLLTACTAQTIVLTGISGGASALAVAPHPWSALTELFTHPPTPEITKETQQLIQSAISSQLTDLLTVNPQANISLDIIQAINSALLASGMSIEQINAVRSRIDRLKGGGLVERVHNGKVIGLILSDVIGDPIAVIASGLTNHPDADNFAIGNNHQACAAVAQAAQEMGYDAQIVTTELDGEARIRGAQIAREIIARPARTVLIYGGETTVTLPHNCQGKGGRNQELGLAAAIELAAGDVPAWIVTLATDGTDGPTDAAGVTIDETTIDRALKLGLDAQLALDEHNSYPFFDRLGDLHRIGATGTNVADITIAIVD